MSLDFDFKAVKTLPNGDDPTHHPFDKTKWHAVGDALVWATLSVGIGEINDKTIDTFVRRVAILQKLDGPMLRANMGKGKLVDVYITRADIEAFKGLKTNAKFPPYETDAAWAKRVLLARIDEPRNVDDKPAYVLAHESAKLATKGKTIELAGV